MMAEASASCGKGSRGFCIKSKLRKTAKAIRQINHERDDRSYESTTHISHKLRQFSSSIKLIIAEAEVFHQC